MAAVTLNTFLNIIILFLVLLMPLSCSVIAQHTSFVTQMHWNLWHNYTSLCYIPFAPFQSGIVELNYKWNFGETCLKQVWTQNYWRCVVVCRLI